MRNSKPCLLAALFIAAGVTACDESPASSLEPGMPVLATRTDQGNVRESFSIIVDNPCTPAVEAILDRLADERSLLGVVEASEKVLVAAFAEARDLGGAYRYGLLPASPLRHPRSRAFWSSAQCRAPHGLTSAAQRGWGWPSQQFS